MTTEAEIVPSIFNQKSMTAKLEYFMYDPALFQRTHKQQSRKQPDVKRYATQLGFFFSQGTAIFRNIMQQPTLHNSCTHRLNKYLQKSNLLKTEPFMQSKLKANSRFRFSLLLIKEQTSDLSVIWAPVINRRKGILDIFCFH